MPGYDKLVLRPTDASERAWAPMYRDAGGQWVDARMGCMGRGRALRLLGLSEHYRALALEADHRYDLEHGGTK